MDNSIPIPRNIEAFEKQTKEKRENENLMRKLGNTIESKLRLTGALKIKIAGVVYDDKNAAVKASYQMGLNEMNAEFHLIKDNLGNFAIKGFENSINAAVATIKTEDTYETFEAET